MKEKMNETKVWLKEHKNEIAKEAMDIVKITACLGIGYFMGSKITELQIGYGLDRVHRDGLVKFFNPSTGLEVSMQEINKIMSDKYKA